jgi:hypothetical protein
MLGRACLSAYLGRAAVLHHLHAAPADSASLPRCAACGSFPYTSPVTNHSYLMSNCANTTFDQGQAQCNAAGGHLVIYNSKAEQEDAEGYFISLGGARALLTHLHS